MSLGLRHSPSSVTEKQALHQAKNQTPSLKGEWRAGRSLGGSVETQLRTIKGTTPGGGIGEESVGKERMENEAGRMSVCKTKINRWWKMGSKIGGGFWRDKEREQRIKVDHQWYSRTTSLRAERCINPADT